jgi:hypothetical protein
MWKNGQRKIILTPSGTVDNLEPLNSVFEEKFAQLLEVESVFHVNLFNTLDVNFFCQSYRCYL